MPPHTGSSANIEHLLEQQDWLTNLVRQIVRNEDLADDLVQDTWEAALRYDGEPIKRPRAWLMHVAKRQWANLLRARQRRVEREQSFALERLEYQSDHPAEYLELVEVLFAELQRLSSTEQRVLLLKHQGVLPPRKIAAMLRMEVGAVRNAERRGIRKLQLRLRGIHGPQWRALLLTGMGLGPEVGSGSAATAGSGAGRGAAAAIRGPRRFGAAWTAVAATVVVAGGVLMARALDSPPVTAGLEADGLARADAPESLESESATAVQRERVEGSGAVPESISGVVRTVDGNAPVSRFRVVATLTNGTLVDETVSDAQGRWEVRDSSERSPGNPLRIQGQSADWASTRADWFEGDPRDGHEIRVGQGAEVHATVVGPAGVPVAGATVTMRSQRWFMAAATGPDGVARLFLPEPGAFRLDVEPPATRPRLFLPDTFRARLLAGETQRPFTLSLHAWATAVDLVAVDGDGRPLAGAEAFQVLDGDRLVPLPVQNGHLASALEAGSEPPQVRLVAPGRASVSVFPTESMGAGVPIVLVPLEPRRVRITDDFGHPRSGRLVVSQAPETWAPSGVRDFVRPAPVPVDTFPLDGNGEATVLVRTGSRPPALRLEFAKVGGDAFPSRNVHVPDLSTNGVSEFRAVRASVPVEILCVAQDGTPLAGEHVRVTVSTDPVLPFHLLDGPPLAGSTDPAVRLNAPLVGTADHDGRFRFLAPPLVHVHAWVGIGDDKFRVTSRDVLAPGTAPQVVARRPGGNLAVQLHVEDDLGRGLGSEARLELTPHNSSGGAWEVPVEWEARGDLNGDLLVEGLAPGTYDWMLQVHGYGYAQGVVDAGQRIPDVVVPVAVERTIRVSDASGLPLAGAEVHHFHGAFARREETGTDGIARPLTLPGGAMNFLVLLEGYEPRTLTLLTAETEADVILVEKAWPVVDLAAHGVSPLGWDESLRFPGLPADALEQRGIRYDREGHEAVVPPLPVGGTHVQVFDADGNAVSPPISVE